MRPAITWAFEACWFGPDVLSNKKSDIATISKLCLLLLDIQFQAYVAVILLLIFYSVTFATNVLISDETPPLVDLLVTIQKHNLQFFPEYFLLFGDACFICGSIKKTTIILPLWNGRGVDRKHLGHFTWVNLLNGCNWTRSAGIQPGCSFLITRAPFSWVTFYTAGQLCTQPCSENAPSRAHLPGCILKMATKLDFACSGSFHRYDLQQAY